MNLASNWAAEKAPDCVHFLRDWRANYSCKTAMHGVKRTPAAPAAKQTTDDGNQTSDDLENVAFARGRARSYDDLAHVGAHVAAQQDEGALAKDQGRRGRFGRARVSRNFECLTPSALTLPRPVIVFVFVSFCEFFAPNYRIPELSKRAPFCVRWIVTRHRAPPRTSARARARP